jgi:hypothetical protein
MILIIPIHDIEVLTEKEVYYIIKKHYEKNKEFLNFGDTIRLLNQTTLKRYFRKVGKENWEWIYDSYFSESLKETHKNILYGLKLRKLISYEEIEFKYTGKKYRYKGKEIMVKIINQEE